MVMASIYTKAGRYDDALDELEFLLSIPSPYTVQFLAVTSAFDPLRDHLRYQALITRYENRHGT